MKASGSVLVAVVVAAGCLSGCMSQERPPSAELVAARAKRGETEKAEGGAKSAAGAGAKGVAGGGEAKAAAGTAGSPEEDELSAVPETASIAEMAAADLDAEAAAQAPAAARGGNGGGSARSSATSAGGGKGAAIDVDDDDARAAAALAALDEEDAADATLDDEDADTYTAAPAPASDHTAHGDGWRPGLASSVDQVEQHGKTFVDAAMALYDRLLMLETPPKSGRDPKVDALVRTARTRYAALTQAMRKLAGALGSDALRSELPRLGAGARQDYAVVGKICGHFPAPPAAPADLRYRFDDDVAVGKLVFGTLAERTVGDGDLTKGPRDALALLETVQRMSDELAFVSTTLSNWLGRDEQRAASYLLDGELSDDE